MSMFQQRHFEAVAFLFAELRKVALAPTLDLTIETFAEFFAGDNPKFNREKFLLAAEHGPSREKMDEIVAGLMKGDS